MMITSGIKAQYTMGTTGMMNIPTAEMQQTGTFMIGGNYLPEELNPFKYNSGNYFVNITFFSFLELNYRCILLKSDYMAKKPKFRQIVICKAPPAEGGEILAGNCHWQ